MADPIPIGRKIEHEHGVTPRAPFVAVTRYTPPPRVRNALRLPPSVTRRLALARRHDEVTRG